MSTIQTEPTRVALVCDDLAKVELVEDALDSIADWEAKYPGVASFGKLKMTRYSSTAKANVKLFRDPDICSGLQLIILDGTVRKENVGGTLGNSVAAMTLLDWLTENMPAVPVMVLASNRVEGLDLRMGRRDLPNIRTLDIAEPNVNAEFARVLHGAVHAVKPVRVRVALRVREFTARHFTLNGTDLIKGDRYEYRNLNELQQLLRSADDYSPMANGEVSGDWQDKFRKFGDDVYHSMIRGTIGEHVVALYRQKRDRRETDAKQAVKQAAEEQSRGVQLKTARPVGPASELRFDFEVASNETARLYALPFELAKPPEDRDNFLCTCVPMARRIHFAKARQHDFTQEEHTISDIVESKDDDEDDEESLAFLRAEEPVRPNRPLRVLFINASFKGGAVIFPEKPGGNVTISGLNELTNTPHELKVVKRFASRKLMDGNAPLLEQVMVVSPTGPYKTAESFKERIEYLVKKYSFDILHFSGHSATLPNDRGTFFILPGENGVGESVSVRVLGKWVESAGVRLVLLSSCSGSSLRTAIEIMRSNAEAVLGFRWDVNDRA